MTGGPRFLVHRLLGRSLRHRNNRHVFAAFGFGSELNLSIDEREQRVILAEADIAAGMPFGAALARDDVAGKHDLAAGLLQAEAPARASRGRCVKIRLLSCAPCVLSRILLLLLHRFREGIISLLFAFCGLAFGGRLGRLLGRRLSWPWLLGRFGLGFGRSRLGLRLPALGSRLGRGGGVFEGLAPSVRISVMRITENSCR